MIYLLIGLSLQKIEVAIQRPASLIEDREGKQILVETKKSSKVEKRYWYSKEAPVSSVGEAFSKTTGILVGEAVRVTGKVADMVEVG